MNKFDLFSHDLINILHQENKAEIITNIFEKECQKDVLLRMKNKE